MRLLRHAAVVYLLAVLPGCGGSKPPTGGSNTPDLASVTLQNNTVTAGQQVQGTVTLTSAPSSGSVTVNLSSTNTSVATVQASTGVAQGSTTSTFTVTGVNAGTVNINASLGATTRQAALTVNAPAGPIASFKVLQGLLTGTDSGDVCPVDRETQTNGSLMNRLNCSFDGRASSAPGGVTQYNWTISNAAGQTVNFSGSTVERPTVPCGSFDGVTQRNVTLSIQPSGTNSQTTHAVSLQKANPC